MQVKKIYEISALPILDEFKIAKLSEIGDDFLNSLAFKWQFDAVYLMGVWKKSEILTHDHRALWGENATSSPFAIREYSVAQNLGGESALRKLKKKLNARGIKLLLDFVPNHTAWDHAWIRKNPSFFVKNSEGKIEFGCSSESEFWSDTAQLDYSNPKLVAAQFEVFTKIKKLCDGLRCDMSHLVLSDVFEKKWGRRPAGEFWSAVREKLGEDFYLLAEVYCDHEYRLVELGFDSAYDKDRFYDRLVVQNYESLAAHIRGCNSTKVQTSSGGEKIYGDCLVRFLENHDEERAAQVFGDNLENALKIILEQFGEPRGVLFFSHGQLEGKKIKPSLFSKVFPREKSNPKILALYEKLLGVPKNWVTKIPKKFRPKK